MNTAAGHEWHRHYRSNFWLCWLQVGLPRREKHLAVVDDYGNLIILGDATP